MESKNSSSRSTCASSEKNQAIDLVGHAIDDVTQSYTKGHRGEGFRIVRIVRPFPRVTEMHVVADSDHDASLVVTDGTPFRNVPVLLICAAGADVLFARNLHAFVDVIENVEDLVLAVEVFDGPVRQYLTHTAHKVLPVCGSMKVVHHEKSAL